MRKKRWLASLLSAVMVLSVALNSTSPLVKAENGTQELPSYNAYEDYSSEANPNGVWTYQLLSSGTYTNLTYDSASNRTFWGSWTDGWLKTATKDPVTGKAALQVRPEPTTKDVVVTFTVPYSGKIDVSMANGGVFAPHQSGDEISFTFKHNDAVVKTVSDLDSAYNASGSQFFTDTVELTVEEGDVLRFIVHRNKAVADPQTYFNPFIEYTEMEQEELPSYNAYEDYSTETNPNGVWTYQLLSSGTYANLTYDSTSNRTFWGSWTDGWLKTATKDPVTGKAALQVRPEPTTKDVVVTFTVPYSGKIDVSMANGGVFAPHQSGDEISFTFKHNDVVVKTVSDLDSAYNASGSQFFTDTVELTVEEGDVLRFIVHRNKAVADPQTYFNPFIEYTEMEQEELPSYNAYEDYSTEANPNGVWTYQLLNSGTYTNLAYDSASNRTFWGSWTDGWLKTATKDPVTGNAALQVRPEPTTKDVVVTFTAPYSGKIDVSMANGGVFAPHQSGDEVSFTFKHNDAVVKTVSDLDSAYNASGSQFFTDTVELTVAEGDVLRFIVHRNKAVADPQTYFNPFIEYTEMEQEALPSYNAYEDYSTETNPNGVWTYQLLSSGTYTNLTYDSASNRTFWGSWTEGWLKTATKDPVTGKAALQVRPEPTAKDVVVTFTAPYSGKIDVSMANGGVFAPHQSGDEISFTFKHNDVVVKTVSDLDSAYNASGSQFFTDTVELTVEEGDVLRFIVHRNKAVADPQTYFNPFIRYTEINEKESVCFPTGAEVEISNFTINGFRVEWPSAQNGSETYTYKVYCSETAFDNIPTEGGIDVTETSYVFTNLECNKEYYVAVVANDGAESVMLTSTEAVCIANEILTYNAFKDFAVDENPNGVWRYSHLANGTYTNLIYDSDRTLWGSWTDGWLGTTTKDPVTGKPALEVRPEPTTKDVVVSFKAPYSGIISISMENGGVFSPYQNNDEVSFIVKHNEATIKSVSDLDGSYNASGKRFFSEEIMKRVEAGDELHFIVHRNKMTADPKVYFNPKIVYKELGDNALGFPSDLQIEVSNMTTDGFTIEWPGAIGGTENYAYTVYCSENPIVETPSEGGISVNGNTYTFTGLTYNKSYYVAVVVDDGEYRMVLHAPEKIEISLDMLSFDAYEDFASGAQNGVWSYLYTEIGKMELDELSWNDTQWGDSVLGSVKATKSDLVTGKPALLVKPGTDTDVVVAFTAPYTGTVKVSLANGGIFVPLNGAGDKYDGINFTLLHNQTEKVCYEQVCTKQMHPSTVNPKLYTGRVFTESYEMNLTKGDVLYFLVNRNSALHNDDTYFNPSVEYLAIDQTTMDLRFIDNKEITATDITKSSMTVHLPVALGGTGNYKYMLYISNSPITSLPNNGGIDLQDSTSYAMKGLPSYTDYYFAVTVDDGKDVKTLISSKAIATIGNTYVYNAIDDYTPEMQPISSPWRYYWKNLETGALNELEWNAEKEQYGGATTPQLKWVTSDMVTGKDALQMTPQKGKDVILAFVSPFSGNITIDLTNSGVFAPYNGKPQNYDGINFTLMQNDVILYSKEAVSSKNSHSDRCFASGVSVQVKAGDILYFIVNANTNSSEDKTFMAPRVRYTYVNKGSDEFGFLPGATIKATNVGKDRFTLNWSSAFSPNDETVTYKVWISTSPIKKQPSSTPLYTGENLSSICKGLKFATKYYAYIVATSAGGNTDVLNPTIAVQTECPVFDAYLQYPTVTNEAGVWNYAVRTWNAKTNQYEYTLMVKNSQSSGWGNSSSAQVTKADKEPVTGRPSMVLHPGTKNQDAAIVFTAPYSGKIRISMNNGGVFAPHNGKDQNYDGIKFFIYHGTKELWNLNAVSSKHMVEGTRVGTDVVEITVKQGDKLYFIVSANKSNAADSTYFNPYIEYLEVTGGTGVIDTLEGFIIPEPEKVYPASYRANSIYETDGMAVVLENMVKRISPWIWIITYANLLLVAIIGLVIVYRKNKKKS